MDTDESNEADESDETLVLQYCAQHNEQAFRTLLERYHQRVESLVRSILGNARPSDIQDVMQDIFVRVYRGLPTFRHEARFSTWLYRTACNQAINHRQRSPVRTQPLSDTQVETLGAPGADPSESLQQQQLREQLDRALLRLPTEYQMAVRLHYWQHQSIASIAEMMTIPENTVKSYLHRARKLLAHQLHTQKDSL